MADTEARNTLAESAARQLANATKTRAQWGGISRAGWCRCCNGLRSKPVSSA
jgi:hypothetical protein